jgi:hypothetical protein
MKLIHYLALCILALIYGSACVADNGVILKEHLAKKIQQQQGNMHDQSDPFAGAEDDGQDPSLLTGIGNQIAIEYNWVKKHPTKALTMFAALCGAIGAAWWGYGKYSDWRWCNSMTPEQVHRATVETNFRDWRNAILLEKNKDKQLRQMKVVHERIMNMTSQESKKNLGYTKKIVDSAVCFRRNYKAGRFCEKL